MTPCRFVYRYQVLGRICFHHLQVSLVYDALQIGMQVPTALILRIVLQYDAVLKSTHSTNFHSVVAQKIRVFFNIAVRTSNVTRPIHISTKSQPRVHKPGSQFSVATKFCTVAPNIPEFSECSCFMSPFWRLKCCVGSQLSEQFVYPCLSPIMYISDVTNGMFALKFLFWSVINVRCVNGAPST